MTLDYIDSLYEARQDGRLSDEGLKTLLQQGKISQWTYERLLALQPDGTSNWGKVESKSENVGVLIDNEEYD